jgi:hypothetical protein
MRRVAHLLCLCVFVSGVCGIALIVSVTPAAADDCKQQVTKFSDLTNEKKLQDCLRTGSQYGRAIGTIVAASGIAIAGAGLAGSGPSRKPKESPPPEKDKDPAAERNPCERMKLRELRVNQLDAERVKREAQILQEWHHFMETAAILQNTWRLLKNIQTRTAWGIGFARTGVIAGDLGLVAGVAEGLRVAFTKTVSATVATTGLKAAVAKWGSLALALEAVGAALAGASVDANETGTLRPWDPWANDTSKTMHKNLDSAVSSYRVRAQEFNNAFAQWRTDTQQDIEQIRGDTQSEIDQWRLDAAECPSASPPPPAPPTKDVPAVTLNAIKVPEDLGATWYGGDWIRTGTGDLF